MKKRASFSVVLERDTDRRNDWAALLRAAGLRRVLRRARPAEMSDLIAPDEAQTMLDETNEALLAQRNRDWLPVILEAAATTEGPVIAAFGAAHLPGHAGVARLLEEDGFTLTREPF